MKEKFKQWWSIEREKNPGKMVLVAILFFNVIFFFISAAVLSALSAKGDGNLNFIQSAYQTVLLVLDTGSIEGAVEAVGYPGAIVTIICLIVAMIGMIIFTGAVIGYVTNYISSYIENTNAGKHKLYLKDHLVILNWNGRSAEIINDFLYSEKKQAIVVLVGDNKEDVEREINERISETLIRENRARKGKKFKSNLTVLVRQGSIFSSKSLLDISIENARSIIIMEDENAIERQENQKGNALTIKTLMQVIQITSDESSKEDQKIVVEVSDDWTWGLVNEIIDSRGGAQDDVIGPVRVNEVLGQILAQFSLMPELNRVYEEMFSAKGAEFYTVQNDEEDVVSYIRKYLAEHKHAIPLTSMVSRGKRQFFYASNNDEDVFNKSSIPQSGFKVNKNDNFQIEQKNIIILGHNTKSHEIMKGFSAFCAEWGENGTCPVRVMVIDDEQNLERFGNYEKYPFVVRTIAASVYERNKIYTAMEEFVNESDEDTSVLILSDDAATDEEVDAGALANLIYVQELIENKSKEEGYRQDSIDVIVEIIDPKHHDIISGYNVNNIVLSNRYVSKMIAQIGEVDALFDFYADILTYDEDGGDSKEIYVKKVKDFFNEIPPRCKAGELIRAVFEASVDSSLPQDKIDPAMVLGYIKPDRTFVLFGGDQYETEVELEKEDKIIVFCAH